jgi:hypothetical protein
MSIKQHLVTALENIKSEKARAEAVEKDRVMREIVTPHNAEVDAALNEALAEVTTEHNNKITEIQAKFNERKQSLVEQGKKKKTDYENNAVAQAMAVVSVKYDSAIAKIEKQIQSTED